VDSLQVSVRRAEYGGLHLQYTLSGDIARLSIPALLVPAAVDGLWEHTCFEAFIGVQGGSAYHEFNFSPSRQWAAYAFSDYRQRVVWVASHPPRIVTTMADRQLTLEAHIAAADLPANPAGKPLQLGLTAVVEAADGSKSYWALTHPAERPDFHHRNGFVHEIWP
jgi:hypothetical protein